jgi:hypothetical protein
MLFFAGLQLDRKLLDRVSGDERFGHCPFRSFVECRFGLCHCLRDWRYNLDRVIVGSRISLGLIDGRSGFAGELVFWQL